VTEWIEPQFNWFEARALCRYVGTVQSGDYSRGSMKAACLHSFTDSDIADVVKIEDVDAPVIEAPNDIIVRIAGAGVCRTDLHIVEGQPIGDGPVPLPHVLGHENAGFVEEVGANVSTVRVGDPVLCYPFLTSGLAPVERRGLENFVGGRATPGINAAGGFAEFLRTAERSVVPLPSNCDPVDFAPLADAGLAAFRACSQAAAVLRPSDTAYVIGVGGLGHLGVQILKVLSPATVVAIDTRADARELAIRLGSDTSFATVGEAVAAFNGRPQAIVDFVGSNATVEAAVNALEVGGRLELVGVDGRIDLPTRLIVESELTVAGSLVGTFAELLELTELVVADRIKVIVDRYPLDEAARALTDLRSGSVLGRAVLLP